MLKQLIVWAAIFMTCMNANFVHTTQTTSPLSQENITMTSFTHGSISSRKRPNPMSDKRISGGTLLQANSWPFLVSLSFYLEETKTHFCGGIVYNTSFIITAAHCVAGDMQYLNVIVTAGEHSINATEGQEQMRTVSRTINHPGYNAFLDHDIALLQLSSPLDLKTTYVTAIEINTDMSCPAPNDNCSSAGWGKFAEGEPERDVPSEVVLSVMSNQNCSLMSYDSDSIFSFHLCTGDSKSDKSFCRGDSGGPLVCSCGGVKKLAGVVSMIEKCGSRGKPGIFTRISCYTEWIRTGSVNYPCKSANINILQSQNGSNFLSLGNSIVFLCILYWCATILFTDDP